MRKGISLVALIITIIVLIILTAAVVITGVNTPQNAQLAVFLNNISTVQEAINLKMLNNMTKYTESDLDLEKCKWIGVIEGYTEEDVRNNIPVPESTMQIEGQDVLSIDGSLKNELSINQEDLGKYYVTLTGQVYYEGFEYNGITYYNKDSIVTVTQGEENNSGGVVLNNLSVILDTFSTKVDVLINQVRYYYRVNGGEWLPDGGTFNYNFSIDNLDADTNYTIEIKAISGGVETISNVYQITTLNQPTNGSYYAQKRVNSPKLETGMIAVYWDTNGDEIRQYNDGVLNTNFVYEDWYDYIASTENFATDNTTSKWANAVTPDGSYWVWIPRYAYCIVSGYNTEAREANNSGKIEIEFLQGLEDKTTTGRTTFNNALGQGNWNIHPAFSYIDGTKKILYGIWVAKYEMSNNSDVPQSKPGIDSWKNISISDCFTKSINMFIQYNSHLIRNSEWGAVAYLAQSKYGRNGVQVGINNLNYITGVIVAQSTTGNKYGVFDMNGGSWEYVAGGISTNLVSKLGIANAKYYEAYTLSYEDRYGDALYEIATSTTGSTSWHGDYSSFVTSSGPFVKRGGSYYGGAGAGLFSFGYNAGGAYSADSFRSVLWGEL